MKKLIVLMVLISLILCSCNQTDKPVPTNETTLPATETTSLFTLPDPLPSPDRIHLAEISDMFGFDDEFYGEHVNIIHRFNYYDVPWDMFRIVDDDGFGHNLNGDEFYFYSLEPEMGMVTFIKHYNIKKEDFVAAVLRIYHRNVAYGYDDIYDEALEIPNADIIYTFDNEIINAYYRRENPVAPDWTKVKTYESYAEYLEENPQ